MKKLVSLLLVLSLACSLALPVSAQGADDRLTAVTAKVKSTLALDTEAYSDFYGELDENILAPTWYLEWMGDGSSLSVSASEDGKILSLHRYEETASSPSNGFAPSFPAGSRDAARSAAQAFLKKVLVKGETFTMEDRSANNLNATSYRFYGEVLLNGLPAGLTYSIAVRCEDNVITSFYRDDLNGRIMNHIPSAKANTTEASARSALQETLALRLEYVLDEEGSTQAILRYLPEYGDEFYVEAASGKLVNLTELAREIERGADAGGGVFNDTAAKEEVAAAPSASLTGVEQAGISKLEGVLEKDTLDQKARALSALGLDSYTLSAVNYSVPREDAEDTTITASLRYGRQVNGSSWRRTVTLDAKTGELIRVSSSAWMSDETMERSVNMEQAQKVAESFLSSMCPTQFGKTALYNSANALEHDRQVSHSFTFAQKENGYFYAGNTLFVGVDATDGSISSYEKQFDDAVTFESPDGILSAQQALDAWLNTYTVSLRYMQVPTAIDYSLPAYQPLKDTGITYLYKLVLGYALEREDYLLGIDAKTGKAAAPAWTSTDDGMTYSDLSGHWAKTKIEALADYNVGFQGGTFRPNAALTQLDLVALLASTEGYHYDTSAESSADDLYEYAYALGLLERDERSDGKILSRAETVKLTLDAMGYAPVAQLQGIFRTGFSDDASIPSACYGYVALAQGLGMVSGTGGGQFRPNANATRAQAAVMLYNLMAR